MAASADPIVSTPAGQTAVFTGISRLAPAVRTFQVLLGVAALAGGAFVLRREGPNGIDSWDILNTLVGWTFVGSGLFVWQRRPANRMGRLLAGVGALWLIGLVLRQFSVSATFTVGIFLGDLWTVALIWALLAFPDGRLTTRFDRIVLAVAFAVVGPLEMLWLLFWEAGSHPGNALAVWPNERIAGDIDTVQRLVLAAATIALAAVLAHRWLCANRPMRWALAPALAGAGSMLIGASSNLLNKFKVQTPEPLQWSLLLTLALIPIAVVAGVLRTHLARAAVTNLLLSLRESASPADLREPLSRALNDPTLTLAYWLPQRGQYVDAAGQPTELVPQRGRTTTVIERGGTKVAAVQHDAILTEEPDLLDAVTAAAGMALENGRLQAELKAKLDELQESRARVVEAGHSERKRLERNLHDGTQQRLVALSMKLSVLERRLEPDSDERERVAQARAEIAQSLGELRDVARGLYPSVLALHGLPAALRSLTDEAGIPVQLTIDGAIDGTADGGPGLPEPVEITAYYVTSECLANIGKHTRASAATVDVVRAGTALVVEVADNGVGGTDMARGSGLRGLADRVEAIGGTLEIWSGASGGTRIRARLPLP